MDAKKNNQTKQKKHKKWQETGNQRNENQTTHILTYSHSLFFFFIFSVVIVEAHRSGCHRWHSCPSDSGSYICGDTGRCSACPNNQFCENGKPIVQSSEPNNNNESYEPHITVVKIISRPRQQLQRHPSLYLHAPSYIF